METGNTLGLYNALATAIADTLYEVGGNVITRIKAAVAVGDTSITVESATTFDAVSGYNGFPPELGRIAVNGTILRYSSTDATHLIGVTDDDGNAGSPVEIPMNAVVMDISKQATQLDKLRASFVLGTVDSADQLDLFARNHGISRPRGLDGETFRALLRVLIYLDAQTVYSIEQVLDVLVGVGNYEIYEDLMSEMFKVFVNIDYETGGPEGRAYLQGMEPQPRTSTTTVTVTDDPTSVYGMWGADDPFREGTNYAMKALAVTINTANPTRLASAALFLSTDRVIELDRSDGTTESWNRDAFIGTSAITLKTRNRSNARLSAGSPTHVFANEPGAFPQWCVGHNIVIVSDNPDNDGTYVIASRVSHKEIVVTGGAFETESNVTWHLTPVFPTEAGLTARILRTSTVGSVVTAPNTLPTNVLVDYTTINSAEILADATVPGLADGASPVFLWDKGYLVRTVLDLITAAGVKAVVGNR